MQGYEFVCEKMRAHTHSLKMNPCRTLFSGVGETRPHYLLLIHPLLPYHQSILSRDLDVHVQMGRIQQLVGIFYVGV